jgi:TonB family protein
MRPDGLDQIARAVVAVVADTGLRGFVLAIVMGGALVVLPRMRAVARLKAWTIVLVAALALPLLAQVVPTWRWPMPALGILAAWMPASIELTAATAASQSIATSSTVGPGAAAASPLTLPVVAAAIYLAGLLLLSLHLCIAWLVSRRLRMAARPIADPDTLARLDRHARAAGLQSPPQLVESARLFVPVTMSMVRPVVALPGDWREWPAVRLDCVLAHEVAHVAQRDALTQRLSLLYRAAFWCSPLSWWLHRRLSDLAEQASDEAALLSGIEPATYAETLLEFFSRLQRGPRRAEWHIAMARGADADAGRRVERILSWKGGPIMTRSKLWIVGLLLAAPVVALTASVRPMRATTPPLAAPAALTSESAASPAAPAAPVSDRAPAMQAASAAPRQSPPKVAALRAVSANPTLQKSEPAKPAEAAGQQQSSSQAASQTAADEEFAKGAYPADTPGLVKPRVLQHVEPRYTSDAMRAKLQGSIEVEIIVTPDGTVGKARIKQSLDSIFGLDEEALKAALKWTFIPGTLHDLPVPVHTMLTLQFRLH